MDADYRVMIPSFLSPPTPEDMVNHLYRTRKSLPYNDCHQAVDSGHTNAHVCEKGIVGKNIVGKRAFILRVRKKVGERKWEWG